MLLCSILIATRNRTKQLFECINSINAAAGDNRNYEIILRMDDDDPKSILAACAMAVHQRIRIVIGPRLRGAGDGTRFIGDMVPIAHGQWLWFMNDDVTVEGPWTTIGQASKNHIVIPENHRLNNSDYARDMSTPFFFLPNKFWRRFTVGYDEVSKKFQNLKNFTHPFDVTILKEMRDCDFGTEFLSGVTVKHNRDEKAISDRATEESFLPKEADPDYMESL